MKARTLLLRRRWRPGGSEWAVRMQSWQAAARCKAQRERRTDLWAFGPQQLSTPSSHRCGNSSARIQSIRDDLAASRITIGGPTSMSRQTVPFRFIFAPTAGRRARGNLTAEFDTSGRLVLVKGLPVISRAQRQSEKHRESAERRTRPPVKRAGGRGAVVRHTLRPLRDPLTSSSKALDRAAFTNQFQAAHCFLIQRAGSGVGLAAPQSPTSLPLNTTDTIPRSAAPRSAHLPETQAVAMVIHDCDMPRSSTAPLRARNGRGGVGTGIAPGSDAAAIRRSLARAWRPRSRLGPIRTMGLSPRPISYSHELGRTVDLKFPSDGA